MIVIIFGYGGVLFYDWFAIDGFFHFLDMVNALELVDKHSNKGYVLLCSTSNEKRDFANLLKKEIKEYQDLAFKKQQNERVHLLLLDGICVF